MILKFNKKDKNAIKLALSIGKFKRLFEDVSTRKATEAEYDIVYKFGRNLVICYKDIMCLEDELDSYLRTLKMKSRFSI